jgi:hypothetical protein
MSELTTEQYWTKYGNDHLKGKVVESVRYLSEEEKDMMGWYNKTIVIQFTDGTIIFPSMDDEGNDGGALFGQSPKGEELTFPVIR